MPHRPWIFLAIAICVLLMGCSRAPPTSETTEQRTESEKQLQIFRFQGGVEKSWISGPS